MPISTVIHLTALDSGSIPGQAGLAVHSLWHDTLPSELSTQFHAKSPASFALSPLMELPRPHKGWTKIRQGQTTWFRVALLDDKNCVTALKQWQSNLPEQIELANLRWQVNTSPTAAHPWERTESYRQLVSQPPPQQLRFEFCTPVTFKSGKSLSNEDIFLPFPLPESLFSSWLRRWNKFVPNVWHIPLDFPDWARRVLGLSAYKLETIPVRYGKKRVHIGCVGTYEVKFINCPKNIQKYFGWLAHYAFYCGSGSKTTQGMGMTRLAEFC